MNEEEKNELFYRTGDKVSIAVMQLYSLRLLSQISNASRCGHALSGAIELQHRLVPIESPIPVASGHFGRCTVGFIHKLCGWIRFIFAPICKQKHHTCKISAQVLDTTLTCIIRGVLMWKKKIYFRPNFFYFGPAENFNKVLFCFYPPPSSDVPSSVLFMLEAGLPVLAGPFCWFAGVAFLAGCSLWWNSFSGTMCTFWLFNRPE